MKNDKKKVNLEKKELDKNYEEFIKKMNEIKIPGSPKYTVLNKKYD
ncbi:MAG: hypothetical protein PHF86_03235 [Candidatus Nanoarchaeia archaeon]|jgi:hypothetical protein|nr:hypothetical protein [Candidatus Nanoarchaeia archaeon]